MKITIVSGFFLPVPPAAGGATEKIWYRLAREFSAAGHDVTLISRRWPGWRNRETEPGHRLTHLRLRGCSHTRFLSVNLMLDAVWGLQAAWHLPPGDVVICNTVSLPVYLRRVKSRAGRVAVVLGRMPKGQGRAYGGVDRLLATSTAVADKVRRENPALANRILQFPNPIDWTLHDAASSQARKRGPLTIGYIGRIHPEKGLEQLLDAALRLAERGTLPPWRVVLIGPVSVPQGGGGEAYRDALLARYGAALGGRLDVLPPVYDAATLARHYGDLDVFCYPSLAAQGEGLSIAPLEAMAAGAVPVVSKLDCYRDVIRPGENGFQFDQTKASAVDELADILTRLLVDPDLRQAVAGQARAEARRFDYAEAARVLLQDFERLTRLPDRA